MANDNIEILKQDGTRIEKLKASVQKNKILLFNHSVLVQPGDLILRKMSNGAEETYQVVDPGFHENFHGIPAHYQMDVRKLGIPEGKRAIQHITFNISGPNARVNQGSVDNSFNFVGQNQEITDLIGALRAEISKAGLSLDEHEEATEVLCSIEENLQSPKPKKAVVTALLGALPHIATIATLGKAILDKLQ